MALSRPLLLALLGAALLGATLFAVQNARDSSTSNSGSIAQQSQSGSAQPASQPVTPAQTLDAAFSSSKLRSARFDAKLTVGFRRQRAAIRLSGAFEGGGTGKLPKLDLRLRMSPRGNLDVGFVSTGDKAWFVNRGTGHQVPQAAWSQVVAARKKGGGGQQAVPLPFDAKNWLRNVRSEGTATIGGVKTEHVSASLDAAAAVRGLMKLSKQSGQGAGALPAGAEKRINSLVKRASFDVYVAKGDNVLRRMTGDIRLAIPGSGALDMHLAVNLTGVGKHQRIVAPAKSVVGLPDNQFGDFSRGILAGFASSTGADPTAVKASASNNPRRFRRALAQKHKVVLFFSQGAADDKATADALRALRRNTKVLVLEDQVGNVDAYGKLVEQLSVDQAPATVIVGPSGNARLIEGYVDAGVLRQEVADAR